MHRVQPTQNLPGITYSRECYVRLAPGAFADIIHSSMHQPQRLWAISDIHIDSRENHQLLLELSDREFLDDMLIIAGDATDNLQRLLDLLIAMRQKFAIVAFVPGNHELWLAKDSYNHSIEKFEAILNACAEIDIATQPVRFGQADQAVWVVPLFSWYEPDPENPASLFVEKDGVADKTDQVWRDYFLTRWPEAQTGTVSEYFLALNTPHLGLSFDAPVISFSHFLPRRELMFRNDSDNGQDQLNKQDPYPEFNFSRVAGSLDLDRQIRALGSQVHIYGHQHRNRSRHIDGITYISHCMGYPTERETRHLAPNAQQPRLIWQSNTGLNL